MPISFSLLRYSLFNIIFLFSTFPVAAQSELPFLKKQVRILAAPGMHGRGYIDNGGAKAANYISDLFKKKGLETFNDTSGYIQPYRFPVNTFPGTVSLRINQKRLRPGIDFIVDPSSSSISFKDKEPRVINFSKMGNRDSMLGILQSFKADEVYYLQHVDTFCRYVGINPRHLGKVLRSGTFIVPVKNKLTWSASIDTVAATVFFVKESSLPGVLKAASARVESLFLPAFSAQNVIGYVKGRERPDSFIVFSAHYDHLGEMGKGVVFPGASDNASGVAVMLSLMHYYVARPARYSIAFMAFSGEEAGLLGSGYYVNNPLFPLKQIRMVLNIDIAGDATKGITIVNGQQRKIEFDLLKKINQERTYVPSVAARGQTFNSDHYPFSNKGVPAVYIYTNGSRPWYHDTQDTYKKVKFERADGLLALLKDFVSEL